MSRTLRWAVFAVLAIHMQLGGLVEQVLGWPRLPTTMVWDMYGKPGLDLCEVRWFTAGPGGLAPVDRMAALGFDRPTRMPEKVRHQRSADEVRAAAGRLCKVLRADVRADARCGGPDGRWHPAVSTDEPLCGSAP